MPKISQPCVICGKEVEHFPSKPRSTCSRSCAGRLRGRLQRAKGIKLDRSSRRTGKFIQCEICSKQFYAKRHVYTQGRGRFCSRGCFNVAQRQPRTERPCAYCGHVMQLRPSAAKNGRMYCSMQCRSLGQTKRLTADTHNGRPVKLLHGYKYVWEPTHPNKSWQGWQPLHRHIAEGIMGRRLESDEHVHHRDGDKLNNSPDNLQVLMHAEHAEHAAITNQQRLDRIKRDRAELAEYRRLYGPLKDWEPPT